MGRAADRRRAGGGPRGAAGRPGEGGGRRGRRPRGRGGHLVAVQNRSVHLAYLGVLLEREVGSSYSALDEGEFEAWCEGLSSEELVEVISGRARERKLLGEVLKGSARLHPEVRTFLEGLVGERPGEDLRILAARRGRERSEEGRERLERAMRVLLL